MPPAEKNPIPTSERMKEVALLLKHADKLVKDGDLVKALELIAKARSYDSRHLYALAYEERVRTLLATKQKEEAKKNSTQEPSTGPTPEQKIAPSLQHLSNLAIIEAQHSAAVAVQQEQAVEHHKKEEEERTNRDELRRSAIETKIAAFLTNANGYFQRKEYHRALDEIARAYLLDPVNDQIHALEDAVLKAQEDSRLQEEADRLRKVEEERQKRQEILKSQTQQFQKEYEEKIKREELERKHAQDDKVKQYLHHVNELIASGKLDEALSELAFVVVIDPLNGEVVRLEQKILEMQEQYQQQQLELYQKQLEERQKKREAVVAAIKKHIANAELLATQEKFTDALRTITRAAVLDPVNDELQDCERRILAMQEEYLRREEESKRELQDQIHRQQEEELRRIERIERERAMEGETEETRKRQRAEKKKIHHYLDRAKKFLSERQFESALGEVALAFIVDPFDEDVKKVELLILQERETVHAMQQNSVQQSVQEKEKTNNSVAEKIRLHMAEAEQLRTKKQFSKAFNEVAKAFILDPLNPDIQGYEQQLQVEFDAFLSEEHRKRETEEKNRIILRHLEHAREFLERELFEEALSEVLHGLTTDEHHMELLALKESISAASRQWKEQQRSETKNLEIQKLLVVAREFIVVEKFEEAAIAVRKALEFDPQRAESLALLKDIETMNVQPNDPK